ncbi:cation diffusion facilitator family transporter [Candidatus Cyanaurora vandensis]|uniref:cation diffusion facilitator family transporter n=1 Tax=Candidatus Cyanaurora vandensis TaxID=2714958 RepID=UPI002579CFFC|nr:cation diffusion facilitator family transporter [Candidatus Cyanaurora vandensis]
MASGSQATVVAALIGNGLITISKVGAAVVSGSTAMLAESLHSFADTSNQLLLLYGLNQGKRPADARRPLGYGREVYFWTFTVSVVIFFLGGVFAIYEGTKKAFFETEAHSVDPFWSYIVLTLAILFESYSLSVAVKEFNNYRQERPFWKTILETRDPVIPTVLFEDTAAIVGSAVALVGLWITVTFDLPIVDGLTSIVIGIILCVVGVFLALESRSLLIGEGASDETYTSVRASIGQIPEILSIEELLIPQLGPEEVMVTLAVTFRPDLSLQQVEQVIDRTEEAIRAKVPTARRIFIEAESLTRLTS